MAMILMGSVVFNPLQADTMEYTYVTATDSRGTTFFINGEQVDEATIRASGEDQKHVGTTTVYDGGSVSSITVKCKGAGTGCNAAKEQARLDSMS